MNTRRPLISAAACLALLVPGCDDTPLTGPPQLRLGRDECAECGMLINEDRCSSGLLVEAPLGSGRRRHLLYDDIGCMLDAERTRAAEFTVLERYVHDQATRAWVRAEQAHCVLADRQSLHTPMGSGMVAFAERPDADAAARQHKGAVTDYAGLIAAREAWWAARLRESEKTE